LPLGATSFAPQGDSASAVPQGASSSALSTSESQMNEMAAKHGTKLAAVVRKLQELRSEDPTAKAILFVQFDDLKRKVAGALQDFGIPAVQLKGTVGQRSNIINDWQNNPNSTAFVLLLSLAQSASGTNLTAASHVVFLHPMLAPSAETALANELQAIGRSRRHGQTRSTVHVWRFVTTDTVEQAMTQRNQAALFERESAREAREASNIGAAGGGAPSTGAPSTGAPADAASVSVPSAPPAAAAAKARRARTSSAAAARPTPARPRPAIEEDDEMDFDDLFDEDN